MFRRPSLKPRDLTMVLGAWTMFTNNHHVVCHHIRQMSVNQNVPLSIYKQSPRGCRDIRQMSLNFVYYLWQMKFWECNVFTGVCSIHIGV